MASWFFYVVDPAIAILLGTAGPVFVFLALAQAARKQAIPFIRWLVPLGVGTAIQAIAYIMITLMRLARNRAIGPYIFFETLELLGVAVAIVGLATMWRMIKDDSVVPPATPTDYTASREGAWPPAPQR